ncbi:hypothetical protein ABZ401_19310 [Streptomyces sp. NPDC005892]|uniref:hypothetical protein n=1 Tax=Streptomyces sp. NPDC005892 TaxID=3155593 RepID=UPI0033EBCF2C
MTDQREWAGTTTDMYDLHRFGPERRALCNLTIRTYSSITDRDEYREPYMTLRTRAQIEGHWAVYKYRFCPECAASTDLPA